MFHDIDPNSESVEVTHLAEFDRDIDALLGICLDLNPLVEVAAGMAATSSC